MGRYRTSSRRSSGENGATVAHAVPLLEDKTPACWSECHGYPVEAWE
jgi:hypothetical protein